MTDFLIHQLENVASQAPVWGFFLIFVFMTMESTVLPIPSEIVMIPAGFFAYRGELTFGAFWPDAVVSIVAGILGSIAGAWINYFVSLKLGRPVLYKYGKYFFLPPSHLERAEEVFNEHGSVATFACRLLPVLRHLISIPAGLSKMDPKSFTFYTASGAGLWMAILVGIGAYIAKISGKNTAYSDIVNMGEKMLHDNFLAVIAIPLAAVVLYMIFHKKIMHKNKRIVGTKSEIQ